MVYVMFIFYNDAFKGSTVLRLENQVISNSVLELLLVGETGFVNNTPLFGIQPIVPVLERGSRIHLHLMVWKHQVLSLNYLYVLFFILIGQKTCIKRRIPHQKNEIARKKNMYKQQKKRKRKLCTGRQGILKQWNGFLRSKTPCTRPIKQGPCK